MKRHLIAAALGLTASMPTLAVDFVANDPTPVGDRRRAAARHEPADDRHDLFPSSGINVNTDQSSAAFWSSTTPSAASSIPTLVAEFTANAATQSFGIWFGTDTDNIVSYDLLLGGAVANDAVGMTIVGNTLDVFGPASACGTKFNCGTFTNALINPNSFGFFFKPSPNEPDLLLARPAQRAARATTASSPSRTAAPPTGCSPTRTAPTGTTTTWPSRSSRSRPCRSPRPTR